MNRLLDISSETWALCLVAMTGLLLFTALVMEHAFAMEPCPLCLMQRVWFFLAGAFAFVSLLHNPRWGIYPLCTMLAAFVGGGFSIRQLYLQSLPADQVPACGPDMAYMLEAFPLSEVIIAMTRGTGDCAEVAWRFLGLSIPGWALLSFAAIIVVAALQLRAGARQLPKS
jgi:disulfide bond formation protein DsbB